MHGVHALFIFVAKIYHVAIKISVPPTCKTTLNRIVKNHLINSVFRKVSTNENIQDSYLKVNVSCSERKPPKFSEPRECNITFIATRGLTDGLWECQVGQDRANTTVQFTTSTGNRLYTYYHIVYRICWTISRTWILTAVVINRQ